MVQEFTQRVQDTVTEMLNGIHTAIPGKIVKFDKAKCEAEIKPLGKFQKPNGDFIDYPNLHEVPIWFFQGNGQKSTIVYPIVPGDGCWVMVSEYTLDAFRTEAESENDLKFDLTNAVAIVGLFNKPTALAAEAVDDDALIIEHNKNRVKFKGDDEITVHLDGFTSYITLKPDGITVETKGDTTIKTVGETMIESKGDIHVHTDGNIGMNAVGNISIDAKGTVAISAAGNTTVDTPSNMGWHVGGNFEITADGKVSIQGADIDVNADGGILLQGATVSINP